MAAFDCPPRSLYFFTSDTAVSIVVDTFDSLVVGVAPPVDFKRLRPIRLWQPSCIDPRGRAESAPRWLDANMCCVHSGDERKAWKFRADISGEKLEQKLSKSQEQNRDQDGFWTQWPSKFVIVVVVIVALTCSSASLSAELRELRTFSLGPHSARWTLFDRTGSSEKSAMAVSALGDLFVLSSKHGGNWELIRIRNWSGAIPDISHLLLPGYFSRNDRHQIENFYAQLLLTPDGRYAVCIGSAEWARKGPRKNATRSLSENVITIVNMQNFTIEQRRQTSDLGLFELQSFGMTSGGRLFVDSMARSSQAERVLIPLDLPTLQAGRKCEYKWSGSRPGKDAEPISVTIEGCAQALSPSSLEQVLAPVPSPVLSGFACGKASERLCPQPDHFTPDRRFGIGLRAEGHDSMLGRRVWRGRAVVAHSTRTRSEIGEIGLMHNSVELLLPSLAGKDYLLILRSDSELAVYELLDEMSPP